MRVPRSLASLVVSGMPSESRTLAGQLSQMLAPEGLNFA